MMQNICTQLKTKDNTIDSNNYIVSTFYRMCDISDVPSLVQKLKDTMVVNNVFGTIICSPEGINGTIAGLDANLKEVYNLIKSSIGDFVFRESSSSFIPFKKSKVKNKKEVVRMDGGQVRYNPGEYLEGEDWDRLISNKETIVIDTRNDYEFDIGTFENAINPNIQKFSQFPEWFEKNFKNAPKDKPIAMFCTGGIRCEKTTSYVKSLGFEKIYHLKDGIITYLQQTKNKNKKWKGDCFIFDDRVILDY